MDIARGLRFPFQDPEWLKKIAIGSLVLLVPILNIAAIGFAVDTLRNVYHERETPLPSWNELGTLFVRGLLAVVVQLLWSLPLLVLLCPAFALLVATGAASGNEDPGALFALANVCAWGMYVVLALALMPFTLTAQTRYAVTNTISDALPGPVWAEVRGNLGTWLKLIGLVVLSSLAITVVALPVILITFGLGFFLLIPLQFYIQLVVAHWQAQAHRASVGPSTRPSYMV